jgi:hypothetical protein
MKKQTAVEWLAIKFSQSSEDELAENINIWFGQAKAMEKEQIKEAYRYGESNNFYRTEISAKDYYTSTYGQ